MERCVVFKYSCKREAAVKLNKLVEFSEGHSCDATGKKDQYHVMIWVTTWC